MSIRSRLAANGAKSLSVTVAMRNTETSESFRAVDVTEYVGNDFRQDKRQIIQGIAVGSPIPLQCGSDDLANVTETHETKSVDMARAIRDESGLTDDDIPIPTSADELTLLKLQLIKNFAPVSEDAKARVELESQKKAAKAAKAKAAREAKKAKAAKAEVKV
jgi:hypothetical protein